MCSFSDADNQGRQYFINLFAKYFKKIITGSTYCKVDVYATGTTGTEYEVEIKKRNYSITQYSGNSIIEDQKIYHFYNQYKDYPNKQYKYFVIFNDGYISYNISNRIKQSSHELLIVSDLVLPVTTMGKHTNIIKKVGYLKASKLYNDKVSYTPH